MNGVSENDRVISNYGASYRGWLRPYRNEEFQESDVWDVANAMAASKDEEYSNSGVLAPAQAGVLLSRRLPSATTMIPASNKRPQAGLMQEDDQFSNYSRMTQQQSAPVAIPDWSKIYGPGVGGTTMRRDSCGAESDEDDDIEEDERCNTDDGRNYKRREVAGVVVPPHEWLARRNKMPSFSVCEGAGRTLKGRDLRRVRTAVLARTGFL